MYLILMRLIASDDLYVIFVHTDIYNFLVQRRLYAPALNVREMYNNTYIYYHKTLNVKMSPSKCWSLRGRPSYLTVDLKRYAFRSRAERDLKMALFQFKFLIYDAITAVGLAF